MRLPTRLRDADETEGRDKDYSGLKLDMTRVQ